MNTMFKKQSPLFAGILFSLICTGIINAQQINHTTEEQKPLKGPDAILHHLQNLYGEEFVSSDRHLRVRQELSSFPAESKTVSGKGFAVNSWEHIGGYGVPVSNNINFTGRITDIEMRDTFPDHVRVVSASGGLWEFQNVGGNLVPVSLSSQVSSEWGGCVLTDPNDENTIFLGTGEPAVHGGTGLYKTTDRGITWTQIPITPSISSFTRLIYDPVSPNVMHAATGEGYFRSDDGGNTWTQKYAGTITDVLVDWSNNQNIFVARWGQGIYNSTDGGTTFTKITTGGLPSTNVGRTEMAQSKQNAAIIFICMTKNNNNETYGIYKTTDGGVNWVSCPIIGSNGQPVTNFHGNQGWYNNTISVSPTNDSIVLCGGVGVVRTYDGFNFTDLDGKHADQHAMEFSPNGSVMFLGNDGGIFYSINGGINFGSGLNSRYNILPVGQYYHFSVGKSNPKAVAGTLQDNGYQYKSFGSNYNWATTGGGDGSGVQVDPNDELVIMHGNGIFGGSLASRRFVTIDGGSTYTDVNSGIGTCTDWFPEIRTDAATGVYYTACGAWIYESFDLGTSWSAMNTTPFSPQVLDFEVSADQSGVPNIYVTFGNSHKIMWYDRLTMTWSDRVSNISSGVGIYKVCPTINDPDGAYALANGTSTGTVGKKVWKTTDRGQSWVNVSGNLPNIACTDLIEDPYNTNTLYLASEAGVWRTDDGGATWSRWDNGMPESVQVTELDFADSTSINGKFYLLCSTYGRGIWMRDVSGTDPTGFNQTIANNGAMLFQNTNNPGDGNTIINFSIEKSENVKLRIFNMLGNEVALLVNENRNAGTHNVIFDRSALSPGVYIYKLECGNTALSRKMVVTRAE